MSYQVVDLDVGGTRFRSTASTLNKAPYLEALLRNRHEGAMGTTTTEGGALFIDRSPKLFDKVLEFLRAGHGIVASSEFEATMMIQELSFYGLTGKLTKTAAVKADVEGAVLSARWSSEGEKVKIYIEAPPAVARSLQATLEDEDWVEEQEEQGILSVECELDDDDPRHIPFEIAKFSKQLRKKGFVETGRSESSCLAQMHLDAQIKGTLGPRTFEWQRTTKLEDLEEDENYSHWNFFSPEVLPQHHWWISETVSFTRKIVQDAAAPLFIITVEAVTSPHLAQSIATEVETNHEVGVPAETETGAASANPVHHMAAVSDDISSVRHRPTEVNVASQPSKVAAQDQDVQTALQLSEADAAQEDNASIAKAVLLSKAEGNICVVLRMTHHSARIKDMLMQSPALAHCVARVQEAGCSVCPSWANGALLLVPLLADHVEEYAMVLSPHNIVALAADEEHIQEALAAFPRRLKPRCKLDNHAWIQQQACLEPPASHGMQSDIAGQECCASALEKTSRAAVDETANALDWEGTQASIEISVERTFVHFGSYRHHDAASLVQSAPCGSTLALEPINPRNLHPE